MERNNTRLKQLTRLTCFLPFFPAIKDDSSRSGLACWKVLSILKAHHTDTLGPDTVRFWVSSASLFDSGDFKALSKLEGSGPLQILSSSPLTVWGKWVCRVRSFSAPEQWWTKWFGRKMHHPKFQTQLIKSCSHEVFHSLFTGAFLPVVKSILSPNSSAVQSALHQPLVPQTQGESALWAASMGHDKFR